MLLSLAGGASAVSFPVPARLTLAPQESQHCLKDAGGGRADCGIVDQVKAAFSERVTRMFAAGVTPALELVLTVEGAEAYEHASGGLNVELRTRTRVVAADGTPIDEIEAVARITVTQETPVLRAAAVTADHAAAAFELRLENSTRLRDYLVAKGLARAIDLAAPERGDRFFWIAAGGALVQGGGDGDPGVSPNLRVALTIRPLMLQVTYAHLRSSFAGTSRGALYDSDLVTNDFGLEAGAVLRLKPAIEVRAGPGVHYLIASGSSSTPFGAPGVSASANKWVAEAFASLSMSVLPLRNGARFVAGIEVRTYFSTRMDLPAFNRGVPVANTAFTLFFGGEFPWGRRGTAP